MAKSKFLPQSGGFLLFLIYFAALMFYAERRVIPSTLERVSQFGYSVEEHVIHTKDGYILTVFRITGGPKSSNASRNELRGGVGQRKPAALLQHGLGCSSDTWLMPGPQNALPYLLVDAGFDVWLGNARGNRYSQRHRVLNPHPGSAFWNYSTQDIGVYDLSAIVERIGQVGGQQSVHFVGYSAGTTAILMWLAEEPQYNERFSSIHLLGPISFMSRGRFSLHRFSTLVWHKIDGFANRFVTSFPALFHSRMLSLIGRRPCEDGSGFQWACKLFFGFSGGWGSRHMNTTLLHQVAETHPAGASTTQIIHYLQIYNSGEFRQYDHGAELNKLYYHQETPPAYKISNIRTCTNLYYSDNDYMAAVEDVEKLGKLLPCSELYHVPYKDWNHYDFVWSLNVKEVINDRIIDTMIRNEREKERNEDDQCMV